MLNLIKKLAILDGANVVQLDNIMSGVDGASTFGYSLTPTAVQINDNQRQQYKFTHQLDVRTLDPGSTDRSNLAFIEENQRTVTAVGLSENGFLTLQGKLTRNDQYDQVVADRFLLTADTVAGYVQGYYSGDNLLAQTDLLDPDGFASLSGHDCTVSGDEMTFTRTSGVGPVGLMNAYSGAAQRYTVPFSSENIRLQIEIVSFTTTAGTASLELRFYDVSGATISTSVANITSTGIIAINAVIPSGTIQMEPLMRAGTNVGNNIVCKKPMLSRGQSVFTL